jgi:hypothetical protein
MPDSCTACVSFCEMWFLGRRRWQCCFGLRRCTLNSWQQRFRETYCLHFQDVFIWTNCTSRKALGTSYNDHANQSAMINNNNTNCSRPRSNNCQVSAQCILLLQTNSWGWKQKQRKSSVDDAWEQRYVARWRGYIVCLLGTDSQTDDGIRALSVLTHTASISAATTPTQNRTETWPTNEHQTWQL